jgi:hypothetical protein
MNNDLISPIQTDNLSVSKNNPDLNCRTIIISTKLHTISTRFFHTKRTRAKTILFGKRLHSSKPQSGFEIWIKAAHIYLAHWNSVATLHHVRATGDRWISLLVQGNMHQHYRRGRARFHTFKYMHTYIYKCIKRRRATNVKIDSRTDWLTVLMGRNFKFKVDARHLCVRAIEKMCELVYIIWSAGGWGFD